MDISRVDDLLKKVYCCEVLPSRELTSQIVKKVQEDAKRKTKFPIKKFIIAIVSFSIVIILAMKHNEVKAAVESIYNSFLAWCDGEYNNDTEGIKNEFYQEKSIGEYVISIDRLVFSEHELYIGYSIKTDEIDPDDLISFSINYGNNIISDSLGVNKLFSDCMSYDGKNNSMCIDGWNTSENQTYEGFVVWRGEGLNYENKTVALECYLYDSDTKEGYTCSFDISLTSEYKYEEQTKALDYSFEKGDSVYYFDSIIYTFSGLMITGRGEDAPSNVWSIIRDEEDNEITIDGSIGYDDKFALFYCRDSSKDGGEYTVTLYDNDNRNIELYETKISFE